jgi:hypothetical protein
MTGCECKSGFFSLRDCDGAPAGACSECGRTACTRHLSPASGFTQCLDCHARAAQQPQEGQAAAAGEPALDDEWTYGARHRFYTSGYSPVYTGSHRSSYYDSYDTRSFDETDTGEADVDEGGAGFGDS